MKKIIKKIKFILILTLILNTFNTLCANAATKVQCWPEFNQTASPTSALAKTGFSPTLVGSMAFGTQSAVSRSYDGTYYADFTTSSIWLGEPNIMTLLAYRDQYTSGVYITDYSAYTTTLNKTVNNMSMYTNTIFPSCFTPGCMTFSRYSNYSGEGARLYPPVVAASPAHYLHIFCNVEDASSSGSNGAAVNYIIKATP